MFKTAKDVIAFIGAEALANEVGVSRKTMTSYQRGGGQMPAMWYDACERLAGRPMPRDLFYFKGNAPSRPGVPE